MPRSLSGNDVIESLDYVYKFYIPTVGTPGSTTLSGAIAQGDANADITAATNFADGDYVLVQGANNELNQISGTPATTDCPMAHTFFFAHASGATVKEVTRVDLGFVEESGFTINGTRSNNPVNAANSAVPITYIAGQGSLGGAFGLREYNNLNLQTVFGIPETEIGSGTSAAPYTAGIAGTTIGADRNVAFRFVGSTVGGKTVWVDCLGVRPSVNANIALGGTSPAVLQVQFDCTEIVSRIVN